MIWLVTGMPRSGTSMLMQACEAGGMSVVRSDARDGYNAAHSDHYYRPNPISLYEPTVEEMRRPGFPRQHEGKALKVVVPLVQTLAVHSYAVAFMRRDPEEIRQSYEAAFGPVPQITAARIDQRAWEGLLTLRNRKDVREIVELWYTDVVSDPVGQLSRLGWPMDVTKAAAVVDATRYRFRLPDLVPGV